MIIDGKILGSILSPGQTVNLGLTLFDGVLTICSADGSALSATNPGYVCMQTATAGSGGKRIAIAVTANVTINDASNGSPQILGNLGTSASVAWGSSAPIFIGMINRDDTAANAKFCLSRCPLTGWQQTTTNQIGKSGTAPVTSDQKNIIIMDSGVTVGDYNGKPIVTLGSITAIKDASAGGSWTVDSLFRHKDGFGLFQEGVAFSMPIGQNGAAATTFFENNGGTAPSFNSDDTVQYTINRSGVVNMTWTFVASVDCGGVGAGVLYLVSPYSNAFTKDIYSGVSRAAYGASNTHVTLQNILLGSSYRLSNIFFGPSSGVIATGDLATGTGNFFVGTFSYKAF